MSVGQLAGGLIGGAIGWSLSGNPFLGAQLGMMVGGYLDPPKTPTQEGPRVSDLTTQTSTYGAVIPRIYGTDAVAGNVIWLENNQLKETATKKKSSGKGGGGKTSTRTYTYSATFAVVLCKGPIIGIRRMWIGPDLVYDAGSSDPSTITASNQSAVGWTLYLGSNTQGADPRMQATLGVANTPAYRGLAYLVFEDFALAKYGNSLAGVQVRAEVFTAGAITMPYVIGSAPSLGSQSQPACAFATWGGVLIGTYGVPFTNYSQYLFSSDHGLTWTSRNFPFGAGWEYVTGYGDRIVAVGAEKISASWRRAVTTTDGLNWAYVNIPSIANGPIICNGTVWCISGHNCAQISTNNALTWTNYSLGPIGSMNTAVSHNGRLLLFCTGSDLYATSDDNGVTWTTRSLGFTHMIDAASNGSLIIGIVDGYKTISTDGGNTWSSPAPFIAGRLEWLRVLYAPGVWVIFNSEDSGYGLPNYAYSTDDGGTWTQVVVGPLGVNFGRGAAYTGSKFISLWYTSGLNTYIITPGVTPNTLQLSQIVSAECLQSGLLTAGDIDVTSLTPQVRGYSVGTVGTIRSAIEPLQAAWPFDIRQHGYKVQFLLRPGTSVVTIPSADLDARQGKPGVSTTISRIPDLLIVSKITVNYKDANREYNLGEQYASRMTTQSVNQANIELPIVLTSNEAAGKAETLLYLYWLERYEVAFTLPGTYNQLEAGDVVTLTTPEGALSLRLIGVNNTSDGRVECKARYNSPAIYTPTAIGASSAVSGPTTITPVGASVYALLDVPMISSAQSTPSFLAAMTGALSGWQGGTLMQSTDSGGTWASLQDFDPPGSVMGTCSNSIGVVDSRVMDNASVLSVTMTQGSLYSITQAAMFSGSNMFAYGADGRWEIMSVQVCTLVSGSSYTLKDMLRGQYGTEWAMGLHVNGDALILLDTIDTALIAMGSGMIGLSWLYRGITADRDISTDTNRTFTYRGVNLMPLSPVNLTGSIDPSTFDWTLSLIPRTRENAAWKDSIDAPIGELSQSYQIDVFSSGAYTTLKRTISSSSATAIPYSSADQVTDFGSNQSTLYLKVYQLSSAVGRGYPLTVTITR